MNESVVFDLEFPNAGRFAPKLTFSDQCAAYVLHHKNRVPLTELAFAWGVHVGTMKKMCAVTGGGPYKRVRAEATRLGLDKMYEAHVNEGHIELLRAKMAEREAQRTQGQVTSIALTEPSAAHNRKQGPNYHNGHEFLVEFTKPDGGELGWYVNIDRQGFSCADGKPFLTSNAALSWAVTEFGDLKAS